MKLDTISVLLVAGGLAACSRGEGAATEGERAPEPTQPAVVESAQPTERAAQPAAAPAPADGQAGTAPTEAPPAQPGAATEAGGAATGSTERSSFVVSGVAAAVRNTRLSMKAGGVLKSVKVREGTWVTQGQPLCVLDTVDLVLRIEAAEVAAKQAQAGVTNAEQDLDRAKELYKGGAATDQVIEKAELALTVASLQADAANVALKAARQALYDATLRAPFAGAVTKVLAEEGMMITTMPPTAIFQLVDTSALEVRVQIPERMLSQIEVGQPVVVSLPAVKLEKKAQVDRMTEVVDPVTRSVEAVIRLGNEDRAIPAGLYARVRFPGVHPDLGAALAESSTGEAQP